MLEVQSSQPRARLLRIVLALAIFIAFIALFVWVAYVTMQPTFAYYPTPHFGRHSGSARLFYLFLLALPWWLRPVAVLWVPTFFVLLVAPLFWRIFYRRFFNEPVFKLDEFGITGNTADGTDQFLWQDIIELSIHRSARMAIKQNSAITLYAKITPQSFNAKVPTLEEQVHHGLVRIHAIALYFLGLKWLAGKPMFTSPTRRQMVLATDRQDFDVAAVMKFIRRKRPDLVEKLPTPTFSPQPLQRL
jgi:TRAP-type C4-dicarboxylate transport system permease small subunit